MCVCSKFGRFLFTFVDSQYFCVVFVWGLFIMFRVPLDVFRTVDFALLNTITDIIPLSGKYIEIAARLSLGVEWKISHHDVCKYGKYTRSLKAQRLLWMSSWYCFIIFSPKEKNSKKCIEEEAFNGCGLKKCAYNCTYLGYSLQRQAPLAQQLHNLLQKSFVFVHSIRCNFDNEHRLSRRYGKWIQLN